MPTAVVLLEQHTPSIANRQLATIRRRYHTIRKVVFPLETGQGLELLLPKPEGRLQNCVPAYEANLSSWAPGSQSFECLEFRGQHISPWDSLNTQTWSPDCLYGFHLFNHAAARDCRRMGEAASDSHERCYQHLHFKCKTTQPPQTNVWRCVEPRGSFCRWPWAATQAVLFSTRNG